MIKFFFYFSLLIIFFAFWVVSLVFAGNIDSTYKWAWSDNIGWIDFTNVTVGNYELTGYATSSGAGYGIGPISLNCSNQGSCGSSNYKVNNNMSNCLGSLAGWAWNENIGWISFCGNASSPSVWDGSKWVCPSNPTYQVTLDSDGSFRGWAWSENIGWIAFNCLEGGCAAGSCSNCGNWKVKTSWSGTATTSGYLISSIYDSQVAGGIAYNTFFWRGTQPLYTFVKFQIASSNCSNGADNPPTCTNNIGWGGSKTAGPGAFVGYDGTNSTWYSFPSGSWIKIDGPSSGTDGCMYAGSACHNNRRYFRYKVLLESTCFGLTPQVDEVRLSWSP